MSVVVKICGITNSADALVAAEAGASALGFVFWNRSPRYIDPAAAAAIIRNLPLHIVKVGVFVDAPAHFVSETAAAVGLDLLQFHGSETPEFCTQFGLMSMKAFRVRDAESIQQLPAYSTDAWLLDAYSPDAPGGTGERFDWALARTAVGLGRPVFLAGGLTADNVAEAIRQVSPYGVDVSSGVEASPGLKDHQKVRCFIEAARTASAA